jgi:hypothetical protein
MIAYEEGAPRRVGHFLEVWGYAQTIGKLEELPEETQFVLEAAAIVHGVYKKPNLEKYGYSVGKCQEWKGSSVVREMLDELGFAPEVADSVIYLVEQYQTNNNASRLEDQILLEANILSKIHKDEVPHSAIQAAYEEIFKTDTGKRFCKLLYMK